MKGNELIQELLTTETVQKSKIQQNILRNLAEHGVVCGVVIERNAADVEDLIITLRQAGFICESGYTVYGTCKFRIKIPEEDR